MVWCPAAGCHNCCWCICELSCKEFCVMCLWICRDARLNAKIDSAAGTVVMGTTFPTAYEQIMDSAKSLSSRTFALAGAVGAVPRA